jgi:hypothetical protein
LERYTSLNKTIKKPSTKVINDDLCSLPSRCVIDKIEFLGENNFNIKGNFSLGVGPLNEAFIFTLIENSNSNICNKIPGGHRDFIETNKNGLSEKYFNLSKNNFVNIFTENNVLVGNLKVILYYHIIE